jgi:hypothetical protein
VEVEKSKPPEDRENECRFGLSTHPRLSEPGLCICGAYTEDEYCNVRERFSHQSRSVMS